MKVELREPGIAGSYEVLERREDGALVLTPLAVGEVDEPAALPKLPPELALGDVVLIDGEGYEVVQAKGTGLTLEPEMGPSVAELAAARGAKISSVERFEERYGPFRPSDGEG